MTQDDALTILKTGASVFLTGEPGSGKTHTVNEYVAWLRSHGIEPAITASTGIAATHIGGVTLHSWSGIGIAEHLSKQDIDAIASKEHIARRIMKSKILIIDEVSMLSGETLALAEAVAREVHRTDEVFGGMQIIFVGDFFQLPPVSRRGSISRASFAFESSVWKAVNPIICYLTEQHRQEDEIFLSALSSIRAGSADEETLLCFQDRSVSPGDVSHTIPRLFAHNVDVDRINADALEKIENQSSVFVMTAQGPDALVLGLKRGCLSPEQLFLKKGAVVMCTKNNPTAGFANGTLGTVIGFDDMSTYPIIKTKDGDVLVIEPMEWAVEQDGRVRARITQVPLRLAWAMTIHKSQGMSMDAAAIDLSGVFEHGHGYVALSRVRTLGGLHILGWSERALLVHPRVATLDVQFRIKSEDAKAVFEDMSDAEHSGMEENFIRACGGTLEMAPSSKGKKKKSSTYDTTLALIQEGHSLLDIAKIRKLKVGTLIDHLEKLLAQGTCRVEDMQNMFSPYIIEALPDIHEAFTLEGSERLSPVFERLKGAYSYEDLRIARLFFLNTPHSLVG
ncbi:MAG: AAA family ATPase [Patescibacteria group bacterium]